MHEDLSYRRPVLFDQDTGTYVTAAQIKFFLNKKNAIKQIKNKASEFSEYIDFCKFYNFFWDITTFDPRQGFMFWDHEAETIAFQFPAIGKVAKYLAHYKNE